MEEREYPFVVYKTLQIMPANNVTAVMKRLDDGEKYTYPIQCWALVEDMESVCPKTGEAERYVVGMILGDDKLEFCDNFPGLEFCFIENSDYLILDEHKKYDPCEE
jgi:hypothetical protein